MMNKKTPSLSTMYLERSLSRRGLQSPLDLHTMLDMRSHVGSRIVADLLATESALANYRTRTAAVEELAALQQRITTPAGSSINETLRTALLLNRHQQGLISHSRPKGATSMMASLAASLRPQDNTGAATPLNTASSPRINIPTAAPSRMLLIPVNSATSPRPTSAGVHAASLLRTSSTQLLRDEKQQVAATRRTKTKKDKSWPVSASFPSKLFDMIDQAEVEGHDDIISFLPSGQSFMVHNPRRFAKELLPKYFKTSRMPSFDKQLNLYGFKKVRVGELHPRLPVGDNVAGAVYHDCFRREDKRLVSMIQRRKQRVPMGDGVDAYGERVAILRALGADTFRPHDRARSK